MKIKSFLAKPYATYTYKQIRKSMLTTPADQENVFQALVKTGLKTEFGKEHKFTEIKNHADFIKNVPIREYEDFKTYIEKIKGGKHNV
ncbi:MAG: GH3 auxin-responsive promoter family protein, partial [Ginsengibacter sp.]